MKRNIFLLFGFTLILIACKTNKIASDKIIQNSDSAEIIGHIKMGLIDYEIIDTTITDKETAEFMVGMMKPSFQTELIYSESKSAELVLIEDEKYSRTSLYDRKTKRAYQFLETDTVQYISEMDISKMMEQMAASAEGMLEFSKMFKLGQSETEIFGMKCDEVSIMQPPSFTDVNSIIYTSKKIPHMSEEMGPMSNYFTGAPLKTIMFVSGLKITFGAIEVADGSAMTQYLELDESKYQSLSMEDFEIMKNN
jgi:hypothetical protein